MTDFVTAIGTALYNRLTTGTALTAALGGTLIYDGRAPQSPGAAYVVYYQSAGGDETDTAHETANVVYTVDAIATTKAAARTVAGHVKTLLHKKPLTISGVSNFWIAKEGDINFIEENTGGVPLYHVGGEYRIRVDAG